ncbi:MAG TPA: hypothetical protein VFV50_17175 [Bdellovibrionales bacterium]|nr:hypothetical protein [Bdellovibrionales bacterium]
MKTVPGVAALLLFLGPGPARATCAEDAGGRSLSAVCEAAMSDPEFKKVCDAVPEYLRLECAGGYTNLTDWLRLRGPISGVYKGSVETASDALGLVASGAKYAARAAWNGFFGPRWKGVRGTAHELNLLRRVLAGERLDPAEVAAIQRAPEKTPSPPAKGVSQLEFDLMPVLKILTGFSPQEVQAVKDRIAEFLLDQTLSFGCMRPEAQQEVTFRVLTELAFPPALALKFISLARKAKSLVHFYELMGDSTADLMRIAESLPFPRSVGSPKYRASMFKLSDVIPVEKRASSFVVEFTETGHVTTRYFDAKGVARMTNGTVAGRVSSAPEIVLNKGEQFVIETSPEGYQQFAKFISGRDGKFSLACSREASEALRAAGIDLKLPQIPTTSRLFNSLADASRTQSISGVQVRAVRGGRVEAAMQSRTAAMDRFAFRMVRTMAGEGAGFVLVLDVAKEER